MRVLLLCFAMFLSACGGGGGGGGDSAPQPVQATVPAPVTKTVIAFYGDSTQLASYSANSQASVAQSLLPNVEIHNEGVNGTTAEQLHEGGDGVHPYWGQEMAESPAKIVMFNHAINDHYYPIADYRAYLVSIVSVARAAKKVVVIETPNPITSTGYDLAAFELRVAAMREVAAETGAPLCDQHAAITNAGLTGETIDGVHPTSALYAFMGGIVAKCIRPLL
jgi:hypothetical protein